MLYACLDSCGGCNVSRALVGPAETFGPIEVAPGVLMPRLLFGTAGLGERTAEVVQQGTAAGFRGFDSAQAREWYREDLVGAALAASRVPRQELFLISKIHPRNLGYWNTLAMAGQSLADLRVDSVDLLLLHYPQCEGDLCGGINPEGSAADSWAALERLRDEGVTRAIGVANFDVEQLATLLATAKTPPAVVMAASDPTSPNTPLTAFSERHGIAFVATSPLGPPGPDGAPGNAVLEKPAVVDIARAHNATPSAVALRWSLGRGRAAIAREPDHLQALKLDLSEEEMRRIDELAEPLALER